MTSCRRRGVAQQLYDSVGSRDKTLKIFTAEEGGAEHVQVDNRQVGIDVICDWLSDRLLPGGFLDRKVLAG